MKPFIRLLTTMYLVVVSLAWAATDDNRLEVAKTKLLFFLDNQSFDQAIQLADDESLQFSEENAQAEWRYWRAVAYSRGGQNDRAIQFFQDSDDAKDVVPNYFAEYGNALLNAGLFSESEEVLLKALEQNSTNLQTQYSLGLVYYEQSNFNNARDTLANLLDQISVSTVSTSSATFVDQTSYLLAATEAQLGNWNRSAGLLASIIDSVPTSDYLEPAQTLLDSVARYQQQQQDFSARVSLLLSADSNVRLTPESEGTDIRAALLAAAGYRVRPWLVPSVQVYASGHQNAQDYNLLSTTLKLASPFSWADANWEAGYDFNTNQLEGAFWYRQHGVFLSGQKDDLSGGIQLGYKQFENEDEYVIDISAQWNAFEWRERIPVAVSATVETNVDEDFGVIDTTLGAGVTGRYTQSPWQGLLGAEASYQRFSPSESQESAIDLSLTALASRELTPQLTSSLKLDLFYVEAEPTSASYERWVSTFVLEWRY